MKSHLSLIALSAICMHTLHADVLPSLSQLPWYKIIGYAVQPLPVSTKAAALHFEDIKEAVPNFYHQDFVPDGRIAKIINEVSPIDIPETQAHVRQAYARRCIAKWVLQELPILGLGVSTLIDLALFGASSYQLAQPTLLFVGIKLVSIGTISGLLIFVAYKIGIKPFELRRKNRDYMDALNAVYQHIESKSKAE